MLILELCILKKGRKLGSTIHFRGLMYISALRSEAMLLQDFQNISFSPKFGISIRTSTQSVFKDCWWRREVEENEMRKTLRKQSQKQKIVCSHFSPESIKHSKQYISWPAQMHSAPCHVLIATQAVWFATHCDTLIATQAVTSWSMAWDSATRIYCVKRNPPNDDFHPVHKFSLP